MLNHNKPKKRCLILSLHKNIQTIIDPIIKEMNLLPDYQHDRKSAVVSFLKYRHHLCITDGEFLPTRNIDRLNELFKIAHRTSGVIVLNWMGKELTSYHYAYKSIIEIINAPINHDKIINAFNKLNAILSDQRKKYFTRDLFILIIIAIPVIISTIFLLLHTIFK